MEGGGAFGRLKDGRGEVDGLGVTMLLSLYEMHRVLTCGLASTLVTAFASNRVSNDYLIVHSAGSIFDEPCAVDFSFRVVLWRFCSTNLSYSAAP